MSKAEKYYREVWCLTPEEHPILGKKHHEVIEMMEDYAAEVVKNLTIPVVSKRYSEKDMDNAYDKGYDDGAQAAATDILG